jgi:hypothetical protein
MEVYRNETKEVLLKLPQSVDIVPNTLNVTAVDCKGVQLYDFSDAERTSEGIVVTLPFSLVSEDKKFYISWAFDYLESSVEKSYVYHQQIIVVTPYVLPSEILAQFPQLSAMNISEETIRITEKRVRGVIESLTNNFFGRYHAEVDVIGAGEKELKLPDRVIELENIQGTNVMYSTPGQASLSHYYLYGDGYYIGFAQPMPDGTYDFDNVIKNPYSMYHRGGFRDNFVYTITAEWGYKAVPEAIKEAAAILVGDYLCPQAAYRDKYIKSTSSEGSRFEFVPKAYLGTGNATADILIEPYKRIVMVAI